MQQEIKKGINYGMEQNQEKPNYERGIAGNRRLKTQAKHNSSVSNSRIEQKLFVEEKV
jgi:hypothetical protein